MGAEPIIINEKFENVPLIEVFDILKSKYKLKIAYEKKLIEDIIINQKIEQLPLEEAWELLLQNTGLGFKIIKGNRVLIRKEKMPKKSNHIAPSTFSVTGVVKDVETGETLPFATVSVKGNEEKLVAQAVANQDGHFSLVDLKGWSDSIQISYLGYQTLSTKIDLTEDGMMVLEIAPEYSMLDEVEIADIPKSTMELGNQPGKFRLNPKEIVKTPQLGEADLMRGMQMLPGISSAGEKSSGLNIRGGSASQNLVLFDGFTIYHLDHFYGLFSSFNTDAVKDVQVYRGGFEAKYGGRVSGLVDITGKAGNSNKPAGSIGVNLLSANVALETPIGQKATAFVSARRAYTDIMQTGLYNSLFSYAQTELPELNTDTNKNENRTETPNYYYYDIHAKVSLKPSAKDLVSLSFYNGQDDYVSVESLKTERSNSSFSEESIEKYLVGNTGVGLRWNRIHSNNLFGTLNLAWSNYYRDYSFEQNSLTTFFQRETARGWDVFRENRINELSARYNFEYTVNDKNYVEFGFYTTHNQIDYRDVASDSEGLLEFKHGGTQIGGFIQNTFTPNEKLSFTLGLRETYYTPTKEFYPEPRFSMGYQVTENWKLKGSIGRYYQFINQIEHSAASIINQDYWVLANDEYIPVLSADHFIVGGSFSKGSVVVDVEFYHKNMEGLMTTELEHVFRGNNLRPSWKVTGVLNDGEGIANGVDILVHKQGKVLNTSVGYTLAQVKHKYDRLQEGDYFAANIDQRHEFKVYNQVNLGKWDFSANWIFHTGRPYSVPTDTMTQTNGNVKILYDEQNNGRLPNYHRLDVSASYQMKMGNGIGKIGLSIFNVYNQKNVGKREYLLDRNQVFAPRQGYQTFNSVEIYDELLLGRTASLFLNFQF
ncbi:TonB-dependent receptor [Flammeovirgaceae bacterium SG7u.111]|nr:TonB-dependent receptor [Flammeovirgaceae bacterium SG7u.132]WPO37079.1 TonB-dependent receptor [Flammeovirgaceae bacterium SG7u.111]